MKIYYQGEQGAYSHLASNQIASLLSPPTLKSEGLSDFASVWDKISEGNIGILPIENSYAGPVHENLYMFMRHEAVILGEFNLEVKHCLVSHENDLSKISVVYSHEQALSQCHDFIKSYQIKPVAFKDTAGAARMISEENIPGAGAICSSLAGEIYGLNTIKNQIQDSERNTTRFFVVGKKDCTATYNDKKGKITIIFEVKDMPAVLYKCLGAFASNGLNLTKIESIPSLKDPFTYFFWLDFDGSLSDEKVKTGLKELELFTKDVNILGEY